ncbi:UDP-glycosyltransferase 83A1-like [Gastrolobium bilobum]|uniref:UDP-glycosyltransferase 83A1-like n=1 Tax=Gastrolobium bilobum TaxID=150636 RepID=UPI002AB31E07|nr:UDP-glycosyltransferase 83A1-like [Gastrolobium bilobum]
MIVPTVLVLPYPGQGHVNPMMKFSQNLVEHGCKVYFVNTDFNHKRVVSSMVEQQESLDESHSLLKLVSIPDGFRPEDDRTDFAKFFDAMLSTMPSMLQKKIEEIHLNGEDRICCIVADLNMGWALNVGNKLGIKGAIFWPATAAMFAMQCNIPTLIDNGIIDSDGVPITKKTFRISPTMPVMDTESLFWTGVPSSIILKKIFKSMMEFAQTTNLTEWWLCNTTYELEPEVLSFVPKLLPVGPLLRSYDNKSVNTRSIGQFWEEDLSCMDWLDQQSHHSVLYVAFGSFSLLDQNQFKELAIGLDLTNRPFLWVVRQDSNCTNKIAYPNEFLGSKGKIVSWAPQQKVLSHPAIACFVSHCGWNSILEGLSNGLPFLCWPYFADQFYNKKYICDELKVGLGFDKDENGLVSRWEIKTKVDQLLSDENIRSKSLIEKKKVTCNIAEGSRSSENFSKFVKWLKE